MFEYLNIIFLETYKILYLLIPILVSVAMIVWLDRRVWALVQKRRGPNVVGPFGLLQSLADALKYIFKEIIIPASANKTIFILAPIITMTLALVSWAVIPFSETFVLDEEMRNRISDLNPTASSRMANRLLEANDRSYWNPDPETIAALQDAADTLEDRMEGIAAQ